MRQELRPLIHQKGKKPSGYHVRGEIFESKDGLLSIAGGKLTGYRKMAERIVNRAPASRGNRLACQTKNLVLRSNLIRHCAGLCHRVNAMIKGPDYMGERLVHLYDHFAEADIIGRAQAKSSIEGDGGYPLGIITS